MSFNSIQMYLNSVNEVERPINLAPTMNEQLRLLHESSRNNKPPCDQPENMLRAPDLHFPNDSLDLIADKKNPSVILRLCFTGPFSYEELAPVIREQGLWWKLTTINGVSPESASPPSSACQTRPKTAQHAPRIPVSQERRAENQWFHGLLQTGCTVKDGTEAGATAEPPSVKPDKLRHGSVVGNFKIKPPF